MGTERAKREPLAKRLSAARGLLIQWRMALRGNPDHDAEIERFNEAIKAVAEARAALSTHTKEPTP